MVLIQVMQFIARQSSFMLISIFPNCKTKTLFYLLYNFLNRSTMVSRKSKIYLGVSYLCACGTCDTCINQEDLNREDYFSADMNKVYVEQYFLSMKI